MATTSTPTFTLIAAEALRLTRQIHAMDDARQDDQAQPFSRAYFEFSRAALSYEPAFLAETMTLAVLEGATHRRRGLRRV